MVQFIDAATGEILARSVEDLPFRTAYANRPVHVYDEQNTGEADIDETGYIDLQELYVRALRNPDILKQKLEYDQETDNPYTSDDSLLDKYIPEPYTDDADFLMDLKRQVDAQIDVLLAQKELSTTQGGSEVSNNEAPADDAVGNSSRPEEG